jgi:hypothetical protein
VRFRRADFIKSLTRGVEHTISAVGKAKARAGAKGTSRARSHATSPAKTVAAKRPVAKRTRKKK